MQSSPGPTGREAWGRLGAASGPDHDGMSETGRRSNGIPCRTPVWRREEGCGGESCCLFHVDIPMYLLRTRLRYRAAAERKAVQSLGSHCRDLARECGAKRPQASHAHVAVTLAPPPGTDRAVLRVRARCSDIQRLLTGAQVRDLRTYDSTAKQ